MSLLKANVEPEKAEKAIVEPEKAEVIVNNSIWNSTEVSRALIHIPFIGKEVISPIALDIWVCHLCHQTTSSNGDAWQEPS